MSQAVLFANDTLAAADTPDAPGFEIGWDHARYRLVPPAEQLHAGNPVRQGWQAGQAVFGHRTLRPSTAVRQWLQLRLSAWLRGQSFEALQVTPNFLAQLEVARCPVTREPLTQGTGQPTDAVVERVFHGAGIAAGNLVTLSARAAAAKAHCGWDDALGFAHQIECGHVERIAGLDAAEWRRLAVLMSLATPLKHAQVAALPLLVLPPNRLRVLNPVQALQTLLTLLFTRPAYARNMADLAAVMPSSAARQTYQVFMHTLLARRVAAGPMADGPALRRAMEEAWQHPLVQRRWQRLALSLSMGECEHIVQYAGRRKLAGDSWQWLSRAAATEGWALESQGRIEEAAVTIATPVQHPLRTQPHKALRNVRFTRQSPSSACVPAANGATP
ncbi:MAG: hypothetical protein AB1430_05395 [Pseudomonadota bacterium]